MENFFNILKKLDSVGYSASASLEEVEKLKILTESNLRYLETILVDFKIKRASMFEAVDLVSSNYPSVISLLSYFEGLVLPRTKKLQEGQYYKLGPVSEEEVFRNAQSSER